MRHSRDSSPGGSHALPPIAPPVAQPVACQRPGTVDTVAANDLRKPHRDRSRDHAQARTETTTSNTDFPAPASRQVTINQHALSILHVGPNHLQHRFSRINKPKSHHKTNTSGPPTPIFPHQQAEKSPQNQHALPILHVGPNHLQHRLSRINKPKSHHKTNTSGPLTRFGNYEAPGLQRNPGAVGGDGGI